MEEERFFLIKTRKKLLVFCTTSPSGLLLSKQLNVPICSSALIR